MSPKPESIIWRVVSWEQVGGGMNWFQRKYVFDDLVSTERLHDYFLELEKRGIENAKIERKGTLSWVLQNLRFTPRSGTAQLVKKLKNSKLEDFGIQGIVPNKQTIEEWEESVE